MKFKSLIFIVLAASMTCTDIYAENNRPIDIALWENGPLEKNDDEGKHTTKTSESIAPRSKSFYPKGKIQDEPSSCAREEDMPFWPTTTKDMPMPTTSNIKASPSLSSNTACRTETTKSPCPMFAEAMRVVKSHAAEWKINPDDIGIMGFSAGGHLASTFATHYPAELRPAFQILVYPVISMDETITHSGSRENLIGKNPSKALIDYYSNEKHVNAESPRAFIALSDDDRAVPVENSLRYYKALHRYQIPVSLHIYPTGGHGWGYNESFRFKKAVHDELSDWLRSF